jgi:hypothetical protein
MENLPSGQALDLTVNKGHLALGQEMVAQRSENGELQEQQFHAQPNPPQEGWGSPLLLPLG